MVKKVLVVGYFNVRNAYRHDVYTAYSLKNDFNLDVNTYDYRTSLRDKGATKTTSEIIDYCIGNSVDLVLICSGRGLDFGRFDELRRVCPDIKIFMWFSDYLFQNPTFWLQIAAAACDEVFIESAYEPWLTAHPNRRGDPMIYMPHCPHLDYYYPMKVDRDLDVIFMGTPHSDRVELLKYLIDNGIKISIFGNESQEHHWPDEFRSFVHPPVFHTECNLVLNRAKIMLNPNKAVIEDLTLSDRYFLPLATKTASVCQWVKGIENIFHNNVIIYHKEDYAGCLNNINYLLEHEENRSELADCGYKLCTEKYNSQKILESILSYA